MATEKTDLSQKNCLTLKNSISNLLQELAVHQKKKAISFLTSSSLTQAQHQCLERLLGLAALNSTLKENFLILSNRLLRLVLVEAGTLPPTENLEDAAFKAQQNIEEAANSSKSTLLVALTKSFLEKYIRLEKEILAAAKEIQDLKKDLKGIASPETFYQKIITTFSNPTQEQKKLEDQSHTIVAVATNLLLEQKKSTRQLFSTPAELESLSTLDHLLEQLQACQIVEELLADLASSLIEQAFAQGQLIKEIKNRAPDIMTALRQQEASIGNTELTNLIEEFLKEYGELAKQ